MEFSPNDRLFAFTERERDDAVQVWDVIAEPRHRHDFEHSWPVFHVGFSPDGRQLLIGTGKSHEEGPGEARVWSIETGRTTHGPWPHPGPVFSGTFSPDGTQVATACEDRSSQPRSVCLRYLATGRMRHLEFGGHRITRLAFSPDGGRLATGADGGEARVWDVRTGRALSTFLRHTRAIRCVEFSADGRLVLTAGDDGFVWVWDARTGEPCGPALAHGAQVLAARFSADGQRVLVSGGGRARLWDWPVKARPWAEMEAFAQAVAGRRLDAIGAIQPLSSEEVTSRLGVARTAGGRN